MPPPLCFRCHSLLPGEETGTLLYCWSCGAPQVRLSAELLERFREQQTAAATGAVTEAPPDPSAIVWSGAIQTAAFTSAVALAFALVTLLLPPVILLSIFWFIGAPIVAVGLYHARFRRSRLTPGFGARLGALCGLAIMIVTSLLHTVELLLARYVFHATGELDRQIAIAFSNAAARATNTTGGDPLNMSAMLTVPEYRVGLILTGTAALGAMYIAFSSIAGAFAGYLRRDGRPA